MKIAVVFTVLMLACATAQNLAADSSSRVPGEYIVVFDEQISDDNVYTHLSTVGGMTDSDIYRFGTNLVSHMYHIGSFRGYGAMLDDGLRDTIRSMSEVQYVECSQYYYTNRIPIMPYHTVQANAPWGLVRTTNRGLPTNNDYCYERNAGEGVDIYILDTGININHPDFGERARWGADFISNPSPQTDLNGHGTHVAGIVISETWGVAKSGTAIAVRVLDHNGIGTTDSVIAGIYYTISEHLRTSSSEKKSIANMSFGGGKSMTLNMMVDLAVMMGIGVAVSAGNEYIYEDACKMSPASASKCVTVGASDMFDNFASFNNRGPCVDIIAPGVDITSTWLNGENRTYSGTSMSAPHVAGVMAKYLSSEQPPMNPDDLTARLLDDATRDVIKDVPPDTPNLLVYKCGAEPLCCIGP